MIMDIIFAKKILLIMIPSSPCLVGTCDGPRCMLRVLYFVFFVMFSSFLQPVIFVTCVSTVSVNARHELCMCVHI